MMKYKVFAIICAGFALGGLNATAQTLFAPSGTLGTSSTSSVGIGISDPYYLFQVGNSSMSGVQMAAYSSSASYAEVLAVATDRAIGLIDNFSAVAVRGVPAGAMGLGTNQATAIVFANAATERMRIDANGNLGIGTSSPGVKVHIVASGTNNGALLTNGTAWLRLEPGTAGGSSYNPLTATGDSLLAFSNGTENQGGLVIAPWASNMGGIKIDGAGNVGIGTRTPTQKLSVNGTIRAKEVIVDSGWSDYVFAPDYRLAPLSEVEQHIKIEGHLPGIPSATEVAEHGVTVGEMQAKLLAKIEELTLHQIAQEKRLDAQQAEIAFLRGENAKLCSPLSAR